MFRIQFPCFESATDQVRRPAPGFELGGQFAIGGLAGANDDVIDGQDLGRTLDFDVQPVVVDLHVGHTGQRAHTPTLQIHAVNPTRRLAQSLAGLAVLALQQGDVTNGLERLRFHPGNAALGFETQIDAPVTGERFATQAGRGLIMIVRQEFRDIETDPPGPESSRINGNSDPALTVRVLGGTRRGAPT